MHYFGHDNSRWVGTPNMEQDKCHVTSALFGIYTKTMINACDAGTARKGSGISYYKRIIKGFLKEGSDQKWSD